MKAAVFYILFLCFGLPGVHNHMHTTGHTGKLSFSATHNTVHKQLLEAKSFIDVEDENDDKDITRKFTHHAKWISTIVCTVFSIDHRNLSANNLPGNRLINLTGAEICIEHQVLRI